MDHHPETCRLLDRQVAGMGSLQNPIDVYGHSILKVGKAWAVGHEPPRSRPVTPFVARWGARRGRRSDDLFVFESEARKRRNHDGVDVVTGHSFEHGAVAVLA